MSDRQSKIIEAAIPLILGEGVGVSTAAIAKAAGVSNGTLFNAFATKQNLIDSIYLTAKTGMLDALSHSGDAQFDQETMYCNWCDYLEWARRNPHHRRIMHLLLEAGLVSFAMRATVDALSERHRLWITDALARGAIRGPNVDYIARLVFFHLDLVIDMALDGNDEALAFDMLCRSIGLSK